MQCHRIRAYGGCKAGRPLTCPDAFHQAWSTANPPFGPHIRTTRTYRGPNPWDLAPHELAAEIARCRADGWQAWELRAVFGQWVR